MSETGSYPFIGTSTMTLAIASFVAGSAYNIKHYYTGDGWTHRLADAKAYSAADAETKIAALRDAQRSKCLQPDIFWAEPMPGSDK